LRAAVCFGFICLFSFSGLQGQTDQEQQVARQYLEQGEWEKALTFYERFYQQRPEQHTYFLTLLQIYAALESTEKAKTLVERHFKKWPSVPEVLAAYIDHQWRLGETKAADKALKSWTKSSTPDFRLAEDLANYLSIKGHAGLAIQALEDWKRRHGNTAQVLYKLVDVYVADNKPTQAANQLIQLLYISPGYYEGIKTRLANLLAEDPESPINMAIKQGFIAEIQKNPEELELASLLMWVFIQETNFSQAFVHAKSIDIRSKAEGRIVLDLGMICREQQAYELANRCFLYVGGLGENASYFLEAKMAEVQNMEDWLRWEGRLTGDRLQQLAKSYRSILEVLPAGPNTTQTLLRYTRLLAFDLGRKEEAIEFLSSLMPGFRPASLEEAQAKIALAEVLIATGDFWEPSLLFGQVEKSLPNSLEGHEAKWGNTRLSFFRGEFSWAQIQAKVLKASTTKHIANDALQLSLLINDLMGEDSTATDLLKYARAEWAFYAHEDALASSIIDSLEEDVKFGPVVTAARWLRYQILERQGQAESAVEVLKNLIKNDSSSLLVDDAYFALGRLYETSLQQPEKALEAYKSLLIDFPGSLHNQTVRIRYRLLKSKTKLSP